VTEGYAVSQACKSIGLARSSYYYKAQPKSKQVDRAVIEVAQKHITYGTRRLTQQLRRWEPAIHVNRKRVQRIAREYHLLRPLKRRWKRTTLSNHDHPVYPNLVQDLVPAYPDHVWVADITYIRFRQGFIHLAVVMDVYTRMVRGWYLHHLLDQRLSLIALQSALGSGTPAIHHSDRGIHYTARAYVGLLKQCDVRISMSAKGRPEDNGYAERIMRTIKDEEVDLSEYDSFEDARRQIDLYLGTNYNYQRIHSALGYRTPAEFQDAYYAQAPLHKP